MLLVSLESDFFLLFWLENDQKLNSDKAYNFKNNINFTRD